MNHWITMSVLIGAAVAVMAMGLTEHKTVSAPAYAEVVRVTPLVAAVETPRAGDTNWHIAQYTWGYDVRYRIGNETGSLRLDHDPGDRIPLLNGELRPIEDNHSI